MRNYLPMEQGSTFTNLLVTAAVSSNTIVVTVKARDGGNLSATNPGYVCVRDAVATTGTLVLKRITSNLTLTIPAAASLGYATNDVGPIYVYVVLSGASSDTIELGVSAYQYSNFKLGGATDDTVAIATHSGFDMCTLSAVTDARHIMIGKIDATRGSSVWSSIDGVATGGSGQYAGGSGIMISGYEPFGTFTPTLYGTTGGSGSPQAASAASGEYCRVGNMVHIDLTHLVNVASTISGGCRMGGLPFSTAGLAAAISVTRIDNVPITKNFHCFFIDPSSSVIYLREQNAGDTAQSEMVAANWDGNVVGVLLRISCTYITDDPF